MPFCNRGERMARMGFVVGVAFWVLLTLGSNPARAQAQASYCYQQQSYYWVNVPCDACTQTLNYCYDASWNQVACPTCNQAYWCVSPSWYWTPCSSVPCGSPYPYCYTQNWTSATCPASSQQACAVAGNDAAFVNQYVPTQVAPNESFEVTIDLQNTGGTTWVGGSNYNLGSQNPQDNGVWGVGRVNVAQSVAPGDWYTFHFEAKAPATPGTYNFQWRMVQDGVQWFGAYTTNVTITVVAEATPPVYTRSDQYVCPGYPKECVGMCGPGCSGLWVNGQIIKKWTCECMRHDLSPRWCNNYGSNPGCGGNLEQAEASFQYGADLGENGLWACDLSGVDTPEQYCGWYGTFDSLEVKPDVAAGAGEKILGAKGITTKYGLRNNPRFGWYDATTDGTLMVFKTTGRAKLGISCVASGYGMFRVGPDSRMCIDRGKCSASQTPTKEDVDYLSSHYGASEVPLYHICTKHGFGWYDVYNIRPGMYAAFASSVTAKWGTVDGHGTMDTFWYEQNACTPSCSGKMCGQSDGCGGTCYSGSGCTAVSCATCQQADSLGVSCVASANGSYCPGGSCQYGTCQCTPSCSGKTCGSSNGCGGTCYAGSGCTTAPVCGNGVCESGEAGYNCGADCCDYYTNCSQTYRNEGVYYCRSMNWGGYDWYASWDYLIWYGSQPPNGRKSVEPYCNDWWEVNSSTFTCGWGQSGTCCSTPNGWVYGTCY